MLFPDSFPVYNYWTLVEAEDGTVWWVEPTFIFEDKIRFILDNGSVLKSTCV
jgi:hypothetical protein